MKGTLYVVGVGPGDPELLTLKAVRTIRRADVIAYPAAGRDTGTAWRIAEQAIPEMVQKERLPLCFPMTKADLSEAHRAAAEQLLAPLGAGKNVALLTLGDPGMYSTAYHVLGGLRERGCPVEIVSGVTSFSAASARLRVPLAIGDEEVLVTPGRFRDFPGTLVVMKAGSRLEALKEKVRDAGKTAYLVENCGMEGERAYSGIECFPTEAGYFSTLIVR